MRAVGGRAAEELIFGPDSVTSGARGDLQQASALARAMVTEYGMSESLGPVYLGPGGGRHSPETDRQVCLARHVFLSSQAQLILASIDTPVLLSVIADSD